VYSLDYDMLVQVLRQFNYSGEVHADVSARPGLKEGGHITLIVQNGTVVSCVITNRNGQYLHSDRDAYRILPRLRVLDWTLRAAPSPQISRSTPLPGTPPIYSNPYAYPRRLLFPQAQMYNWSALQRSVYSLSDGTHTTEQIAILLSRPLHVVEQAVRDLQAFGAIERH
jgi:hypothetical protein